MNTSLASAMLHEAFTTPTHGVLGFVDTLLEVASEHTLTLDWQSDQCRVHFVQDAGASFDVPVRKSVVRAVLARVAVLCNQFEPNCVSPYGGRGKLAFGDPAVVIAVAFTNTPGVQSLELVPASGLIPNSSEQAAFDGKPAHPVNS